MNSKIAIIVPCYNQAQYLDECLQSVLDQTYKDWECIIVNDGSPDNTEEVAQKWTAKDPRFKYLKKENGGLSSARNSGIEMAQGEWILPLDSDDKIHPDYLSLASQYFDKGEIMVITSNARFFGSFEKPWIFPEFKYENLLCRNTLFCTSFFRKSDWERAGKFDEGMRKGFEDWEFWIRMLKDSPTSLYRIGGELFFYRKKETSMLMELNRTADDVKDYIYQKHKELYEKKIGNYMQLVEENFYLKGGLVMYNNMLCSRRYRLFTRVLSFFDKFSKRKNNIYKSRLHIKHLFQ